eukprot:COSAG01_NODE_7439_length_3211_cov_20.375643_1_plen_38_part_00
MELQDMKRMVYMYVEHDDAPEQLVHYADLYLYSCTSV